MKNRAPKFLLVKRRKRQKSVDKALQGKMSTEARLPSGPERRSGLESQFGTRPVSLKFPGMGSPTIFVTE